MVLVKNFLTLSVIIFMSLGTELFAQSKTYANFDIGYGINFGGSPIGYTRSSTTNASTYKVQEGSFGAGVNLSVYLGQEFGPEGKLAGELGFSQMMGSEKAFESNYSTIGLGGPNRVTESEISTLTVSGFSLAMKMKMQGKDDDIRLFMRPGIFVPIQAKLINEENKTTSFSDLNTFTNYSYTKTETRFAFRLGYSLALGLEWQAVEKISVFAQLQGLMLNLPTRRSEVRAFEERSGEIVTRRLENLTFSQRVTEYEKEYTIDRVIGPNEPAKQNRYAVPASYIGLNAGVKLEF